MNISKLADKIKDYKIIGLGEATHGQLKLNEFRNKLIKYLVKKYNFRVIVLEEQYSCSKILDKYIKDKNISYLDGIDAFPFLSKTFVNLLNWLKSYNKKNKNKVSIIGIDCNDECPKYNSKSITNKYVIKLIKAYNKIPYSEGIKRINFRDKCMYKIFMKQYNEKYKYLILSHNGHLQKYGYPLESYVTYMSHRSLQGAPKNPIRKMTIGHFLARIRKDIYY